MNTQYIVVCGNVSDGFTHYGPFDSAESANEFADSELNNADSWHVVSLTAPAARDAWLAAQMARS